jgi:hypothetical protein
MSVKYDEVGGFCLIQPDCENDISSESNKMNMDNKTIKKLFGAFILKE